MLEKGIIRKIDDLGRMVIPKAYRNLFPNSQVEIFIDGQNLILKPPSTVCVEHWENAKNLVKYLLHCDFALLDVYGNAQAENVRHNDVLKVKTPIMMQKIEVGSLATAEEDPHIDTAVKIIEEYFGEMI